MPTVLIAPIEILFTANHDEHVKLWRWVNFRQSYAGSMNNVWAELAKMHGKDLRCDPSNHA